MAGDLSIVELLLKAGARVGAWVSGDSVYFYFIILLSIFFNTISLPYYLLSTVDAYISLFITRSSRNRGVVFHAGSAAASLVYGCHEGMTWTSCALQLER